MEEQPTQIGTSQSEEFMPYEDYEYHFSKLPTDNSDEQLFFAELQKKFETDILTNPLYDKYFAIFEDNDRERFAQVYARDKMHLIKLQKYYSQNKYVSHQGMLEDLREQYFWMIAQKKLFNMQCKWRAGQIRIEGVYCTQHFYYWSEHIKQCPFIDLITDDEVRLLKEYLSKNETLYHKRNHDADWQCYSMLTEKNKEGEFIEYPEWYEYYDEKMGTDSLLILPDIVGKLEMKYLSTAWKESTRQDRLLREQGLIPPYPKHEKDPKDKHYDEFAERFEHRYVQSLHKRDKRLNDERDDRLFDAHEVEMAARFLRDQPFPVYTQGGMPLHEDILQCATRLKHEFVIDTLDAYYEKYMEDYTNGFIEFITEPDYTEVQDKGLINVETILEGRALLGEPLNFDYLPMGY